MQINNSAVNIFIYDSYKTYSITLSIKHSCGWNMKN